MERHRTDALSLVFGLLFVAAGTVVLLDSHVLEALWSWRIWPVIPLLLGVWLLVATIRRIVATGDDAEPGGDMAADEMATSETVED